MLDGASLLDGLFTRVNDLGMSAIAMTDHGNLHGAYDFYSKANNSGFIGAELTGRATDVYVGGYATMEDGKIVEFEVMVRPMSGLAALGEEMGRRLAPYLAAKPA